MKSKIYLLFLPIVLSACFTRKTTISDRQARKNNQQIQKANTNQAPAVSVTSLQYIDRYKAIAIQEMNLYGVPASITLAQGLFESGSGNSELARIANNHFGIKCTSDWTGRSYFKDDDHANDCFRVYDKAEESFRDHSLFLKRKNYLSLYQLDKSDYKGWAYGLKKAGYATNPNYPTLLINIIQKYNLDQYDGPQVKQKLVVKKIDTVLTHVAAPPVGLPPPPPINVIIQPDTAQSNNVGTFYTVTQGDTLYNISKRFGLTVEGLKALNNLTDSNIKIGQKLVVK